ncbi:MAG: 16S rRNA (guanine(527)-N(7))-methyltransferase RsmG [Bacteroides sp.]|nr:16S rRNA (guanine(527)-N(7))-methyltransferase RsmG [Bacteroides sp.]MBD5349617.1 16S rRNA (guanine(527)-N(7))-methyltransferase RsmG [Bacteroides sp.]
MHTIIEKYFPELTDLQKEQFEKIGPLYADWNQKINVISRKDIDNLYVHHVLHSLAIARFMTPIEGTTFLDMGTGGGFPGIPLAIMWPHCRFHLVDRIGKKIGVAKAIAEAIGLTNVTFQHGDIGECRTKFDYVVSRAVMTLDKLIPLVRKNISSKDSNRLPNGLLCLKGGELDEEIRAARIPTLVVPLSDYFREEFFETKQLTYTEL